MTKQTFYDLPEDCAMALLISIFLCSTHERTRRRKQSHVAAPPSATMEPEVKGERKGGKEALDVGAQAAGKVGPPVISM